MAATQQPVDILGRALTIHGDGNDAYFRNASQVVEGLESLRRWVGSNLPPEAVVIDAGGNIGLTALLMSALLPDGHVHVFEALPANAEFLRRNVESNGISNITVNAVALGERAGQVSMAGAGSASHVDQSGEADIPMLSLDDYMASAGLTRVDFIKMDVEGFEPAVLAGASGMIARFAPPILMEFNTWCLAFVQGYDARDFARRLWDAFDVLSLSEAGHETPAADGDISRFFHDNVVLHGTVEDVLLRPRPGVPLQKPISAGASAGEPYLVPELKRMRTLIEAMETSTSWRVTAPVRSIGRLVKRRRLHRLGRQS